MFLEPPLNVLEAWRARAFGTKQNAEKSIGIDIEAKDIKLQMKIQHERAWCGRIYEAIGDGIRKWKLLSRLTFMLFMLQFCNPYLLLRSFWVEVLVCLCACVCKQP